jgi:hypothetical protein
MNRQSAVRRSLARISPPHATPCPPATPATSNSLAPARQICLVMRARSAALPDTAFHKMQGPGVLVAKPVIRKANRIGTTSRPSPASASSSTMHVLSKPGCSATTAAAAASRRGPARHSSTALLSLYRRLPIRSAVIEIRAHTPSERCERLGTPKRRPLERDLTALVR